MEQEQSALRCPRSHRFHRQMDLHDGSAGRVRIQIKLQELEGKLCVQQGRAGAECGGKSVEFALDQDGRGAVPTWPVPLSPWSGGRAFQGQVQVQLLRG